LSSFIKTIKFFENFDFQKMEDYYYYNSEEEQLLQEEYEKECMKNYPLTWELDEYELDHSYGSNAYDQ